MPGIPRQGPKNIGQDFQLSPAKRHLDLALEHAYNDELEEAFTECELARQSMPDLALAYNYLGMVMEVLDQVDSAIEAYLKAIQLDPRFYAARENLANARLRLEAEQYRRVSIEDYEAQGGEISPDFNEAEALEDESPVPGWVYLDEKSFLLTGWPGHRIRPGRSGYDPLETDFELAHIEGVIIRLLFTRKLQTRNPIYLLLMTFIGFLISLPIFIFLFAIFPWNWISILFVIIFLIITSPAWLVGIAIFVNVFLSFRHIKADGLGENGDPFY